MRISSKLYVTNRKVWRAWLSKNHTNKKDIWLVYYKKDSGKPRIEYNAAVEEALCYGWIDGIVKRLDDKRFAQRFSPRRPGSNLSQPNIERLDKMVRQGKMTRAGLAAVAHVYKPRGSSSSTIIATDIHAALKKNKKAWANYKKMPKSYTRVRIAYIESQRKHGKKNFNIALRNFIKKTEHNKRFGILKL